MENVCNITIVRSGIQTYPAKVQTDYRWRESPGKVKVVMGRVLRIKHLVLVLYLGVVPQILIPITWIHGRNYGVAGATYGDRIAVEWK